MEEVKRGEIYFANLNGGEGSVQTGCRPVIIVQNNVGNAHSPTTIVVPLTSKHKKRYLPTHVIIRANDVTGLRCDSVALMEQIRTMSKSDLQNRVGHVDDMAPVDKALSISMGLAMA